LLRKCTVCFSQKMNPDKIQANRLLSQKSPYLLQHAYNPVDWYPWGEEAFRKARETHKPIFLSVGYSTCHWCHVMAAESFSNPETAKYLNENFVSVKVDREERPDIDRVYMQAVQAMTGSGGWPLSVFLTGELKPFYGGTYFPPRGRWGKPGFFEILSAIHEMWTSNPAGISESSEALLRAIGEKRFFADQGMSFPDEHLLDEAYENCGAAFDRSFGGFGIEPKFPQETLLGFLLRYGYRRGNPDALAMVETSLRKMALGGLRDHLGGGFHRYTTDREWHLPHFEKMLYNQALLSRLYLETYQVTQNSFYAAIARETLDYVLRDLTDDFGAFCAAEDADSWEVSGNGRVKSEGVFYVWTAAEIRDCLDKDLSEVFNFHYGIRDEGNVETNLPEEWRGRNILSVCQSVEATAKRFGMSRERVERILENARSVLSAKRASKPRPYRDDKILTDWNALMISSFSIGFRVLGDIRYQRAAMGAADFLLARLKRKDGRLMHRYADGEAAIPAFLPDYAFFTCGLIDLYEATFDPRYLEEAMSLCREIMRLFRDADGGGFFLTGGDSERLILRQKDFQEGALPSGNAAAALAFLRLSRLSGDRELETNAANILRAFPEHCGDSGMGCAHMLTALAAFAGPGCEIVIDEGPDNSDLEDMLRVIDSRFLPEKTVLFRDLEGENRKKIEALFPSLGTRARQGNKTAVTVCRNRTCLPAVVSGPELEGLFK